LEPSPATAPSTQTKENVLDKVEEKACKWLDKEARVLINSSKLSHSLNSLVKGKFFTDCLFPRQLVADFCTQHPKITKFDMEQALFFVDKTYKHDSSMQEIVESLKGQQEIVFSKRAYEEILKFILHSE